MTLEELKSSGKLVECDQGTPEWLMARLGLVTASNFKFVTSGGVGGADSKTKFSYLCALLSERTTGNLVKRYRNAAMEWGTKNEPAARAMYEFETGLEVDQVGFVKNGEHIGASPDGLVGNDGMIQIKCQESHNHIANLLKQTCPTVHLKQIQGELWICGRLWSDFVSFDPRNPYKDILIVRVYRDEEFIRKLAAGVNEFVEELLRQEDIIKNGA
jgi:hypothetical protein